MTLRKLLAAFVLLVAAAVVVAAFRVIGSPATARLHRLDGQRVSDLRTLQNAVSAYRMRRNPLPDSLDVALDQMHWPQRPVDPVTGAAYEYRRIDDSTYELCATFDLPSDQTPPAYGEDPFWAHTAGRQCFTLVLKDTEGPVAR